MPGAIGAWGFQDSALYAEHFLAFAAYNRQHPAQFTDEALAGLRTAFVDRLDNDVPTETLRRCAPLAYVGRQRVRKRKIECRPVLCRWRMTIADVYTPAQPHGAAKRIRQWAAGHPE